VFVPEKFVVTFKPGKEMEEKVRQMEEAAARAAALQAGGEQPPVSDVAEVPASTPSDVQS
jgi:hypothetical protein